MDSTDQESLRNNSEMPITKCGCGFEVRGWDEDKNAYSLENHNCFVYPDRENYTWFDNLFSFWGLLIVLVICMAVVMIITGMPLIR